MNKIIIFALMFFIISCAVSTSQDKANELIKKSDALFRNATDYEIKVQQITKEEFTFERAREARKELNWSLKYDKESLDANNEAILLLEGLKNSSLEETLKSRKQLNQKVEKIFECNNAGMDLLNAIIAHGEKTLTQKIKELLDKSDACNKELSKMMRS
ncbi:hypothetical protein HY837_06945 [archaeon]|nr:hypothetical protein [archaeon]